MMSSYDYIIIGAGSSGCVVASRLTEDSNVSVLLLEAGPSDTEHPELYDPKNVSKLPKTCIDWDFKDSTMPFFFQCDPWFSSYGALKFKTEAQTHAYKGYKGNGVATWPRGKVLGGSSSINHLNYIRGDDADYDSWERLGCEGWGWKDVLPYFMKLENCKGSKYKSYPFRHQEGPIEVTHRPWGHNTPIIANENGVPNATSAFIQAGIELGYKKKDTNCGHALGFGLLETNLDESGQRCNTAKAYLTPALQRHNLTVITKALVSKINFKEMRAISVSFVQEGKEVEASVNQEIILSAGAIGSPQILLLSGIGPKADLSEVGISCIADLQVGRNLQDHMYTELRATVSDDANVLTTESETALRDNGCGGRGIGYIKTAIETGENWPDTRILFTPELYPEGPDPEGAALASQVKSSTFHQYFGYDFPKDERPGKKGILFQVVSTHPKSIGYIKLRSTNPEEPPFIEPNYLTHPQDVAIMSESYRCIDQLLKTDAMSHLRPKLLSLQMADRTHEEFSDENLSEFARHFAYTSFHASGTCKMGAIDDDTAVVDPRLRVRGIQGLRVVDASIMPHLTTGSLNVPCIMIGEKGADIIKQDLYE